jgi:hypothetical protein
MKITKENYGQFVIDYFDGNLSQKEQERLLLFLEQHPDLKEEMEHLKDVSLSAPEILYPDKGELKQPEIIPVGSINESNYETFLLRFIDDDLSADESKALNTFLAENPQLGKELEAFSNTKLTPDTSIVFSDKSRLKKKPSVQPAIWISAAAAVVVLLLGWTLFLRKGANKSPIPRQNLAVYQLAPRSVNINLFHSNPELLPAPVVHFEKKVKHHHPSYVRNPVLIAQISTRTVHAPLIPQMVPTLNLNQNRLAGANPVLMASNDQKKEKKHTFLKLLEGGVKAVNFLTNKDMLLVKTYNQEGQLVHYQILSDNFQFDKKVRNPSKP